MVKSTILFSEHDLLYALEASSPEYSKMIMDALERPAGPAMVGDEVKEWLKRIFDESD